MEVHGGTTRQTVEIGIGYITLLVQITNREVIIALGRSLASAEVVFLTITVTNGIVIPVEVICITIQNLSIRNELTISIKKLVISLVVNIKV